MAHNGVVAGGGRLTDQISIGVLAASVPRDAVDDAVAVTGRQARRSDGKLPPHVMVYFAMAMALFADDDYEEVAARLAGTLRAWGCWDDSWGVPTSGGITQARQRLGHEPLRELFSQVAVPVAEQLTRGGVPGRLAADGDRRVRVGCPGQPAERGGVRVCRAAARTGRRSRRSGWSPSASAPPTRWWTRRSARSAGKGSGEQALARRLYARLEEDWLLIADRGFYSFGSWYDRRGIRCRPAVAGEGGPGRCRCWNCCPTGPTPRCCSARAPRQGPPAPDRGGPRRGGPGRGQGRGRPGRRVHRARPGR